MTINTLPATERATIPAEERGTLTVTPSAYRSLVERIALETPGTARRSGSLTGGRLPKANVSIRTDQADIALDVAAVWPAPVETVATEVQRTVRARAAELGGLSVRSLDVTVHLILPADADRAHTRRVQ